MQLKSRSGMRIHEVLEEVVLVARAAGRELLLEHEALAVVKALGFAVPHHAVVADTGEAASLDLAEFGSRRLVVKALCPGLLHKTELGAIAVVPAAIGALIDAIDAMAARLETAGLEPAGYLLLAFVEHDHEPGGELLLSLRHSTEFGPLVTLGLGGVSSELLGSALEAQSGPRILSPGLVADLDAADDRDTDAVTAELDGVLGTLARGDSRGRTGRARSEDLAAALRRLTEFGSWAVPGLITELEVNPLAFVDGTAWALDCVVRLAPADAPVTTEPERPLAGARAMLNPGSVAVMGVSAKAVNPARIILRNTLAAGFDPRRLFVLRPGCEPGVTIDGAPCVPDLAALREANGGPVDLLCLAIPAPRVPGVLAELCAERSTEGVVLIPGGLGERAGTEGVVDELRASLRQARLGDADGWRGPVINGGNCLGLRSGPGAVDTLFIPHDKLALAKGPEFDGLALLSQSGAFAIARLSDLADLAPRYVVTMGNQLDLTAADWLEVVAQDPAVRVVGVYMEGFRPGDGLRFVRLVRELAEDGRRVILYRAGRSPEGAKASASHTASLAGDPVATRALMEAAGGLFAESIDEFEGLLRLALAFEGRGVALEAGQKPRLGVLSNAGFECVAVADNLAGLALAELGAGTCAGLEQLFDAERLSGFVDVHHPLDVTPIAGDDAFAAATELLLGDAGVDLGLVGCVPLTAALRTLDGQLEGGLTPLLGKLWRATTKPWCVVVDSGGLYDAFAEALTAAGIPVLRSADQATRLLAKLYV